MTSNAQDFSRGRQPVIFTIDGETFVCHRALPIARLQRIVDKFKGVDGKVSVDVNDADAVDKIASVMRIFMKKESYHRFMIKFDPTDDVLDSEDFEPIDHIQLKDIIHWLLEKYTGRPTQPLLDSSSGSSSGKTGTPSTDGASVEGLSLQEILSQPTS